MFDIICLTWQTFSLLLFMHVCILKHCILPPLPYTPSIVCNSHFYCIFILCHFCDLEWHERANKTMNKTKWAWWWWTPSYKTSEQNNEKEASKISLSLYLSKAATLLHPPPIHSYPTHLPPTCSSLILWVGARVTTDQLMFIIHAQRPPATAFSLCFSTACDLYFFLMCSHGGLLLFLKLYSDSVDSLPATFSPIIPYIYTHRQDHCEWHAEFFLHFSTCIDILIHANTFFCTPPVGGDKTGGGPGLWWKDTAWQDKLPVLTLFKKRSINYFFLCLFYSTTPVCCDLSCSLTWWLMMGQDDSLPAWWFWWTDHPSVLSMHAFNPHTCLFHLSCLHCCTRTFPT